MTIEKGKDWGERGEVPTDAPVAVSDAGLAELFVPEPGADGQWRVDGPDLVVLLPNHDDPGSPRESTDGLARTLGARGTHDTVLGKQRMLLPIDLGVVTLEPGTENTSHLVVASSVVVAETFWTGVTEAAMNAAFLHSWNVAPSSHPNDGRFDVIRAELGVSDRLKARKRLPSGLHLPHPDISVRRLKRAEFQPGPRAKVWVDGRPLGAVAALEVSVVADAVTIAI